MAAPDADNFYLSDLVGLAAVTEQGAALGRVVQVHDYGAGASLEIAGQGAPLLVPFTKVAVPRVDVSNGRVVIVPPVEVDPPLPLAGERLDEGARQ